MNGKIDHKLLGTLIALTCALAIATPACAYDWIGADMDTWNSLSNWTPNPIDALNINGDVDILAGSAAINRCVLEEPGNTANVNGAIVVRGDAGAGSDNERLFIQNSTTLDCSEFVQILERGMVVAEGNSVLKANDYVLVFPDTGPSSSLYLRSSTLKTPLLDNVGLVQAEQTSTFEHAIPSNPMQFNNHWPGTFNVECSATVIVDGNFDNKVIGGTNKAVVNVMNGATLSVTGTVINNGIWNVGSDCGVMQAAHILLFGSAVLGYGAEFYMSGGGIVQCPNFDCAIVDRDWVGPAEQDAAGALELTDGVIHVAPSPVAGLDATVELISLDQGAGFDLNGPDAPIGTMGELRLSPGPSPTRLVDDHDNTQTGLPEALYVRDLILEEGITLDLNSGTIYYGSVVPEDPYAPGSGVIIIGDGALIAAGSTGVAAAQAGAALELHGASPNPFNPKTSIRFAIARAGAVKLAVYDVSGRRVRILLDGPITAGEHAVDWNGDDDAGRGVKSGVYFYFVESGGERRSGRVTLLK